MRLQITIDMYNAAFQEACGHEVARILRHLADMHFEHRTAFQHGSEDSVRDANGNRVGRWVAFHKPSGKKGERIS